MELQGLKQQEKAAKEELEKPFAQEAELAEKRMRLAQIKSKTKKITPSTGKTFSLGRKKNFEFCNRLCRLPKQEC